jgi:hypothetical protein
MKPDISSSLFVPDLPVDTSSDYLSVLIHGLLVTFLSRLRKAPRYSLQMGRLKSRLKHGILLAPLYDLNQLY